VRCHSGVTIQRSVLLPAVVLVLLLAGGGVFALTRSSPSVRPDPVVQRISQESECPVLQREFDNASVIAANRQQAGDEPARQQAVGWMEVADARMRTVGCYG
jgi:hypothetical protein